MSYLVDTNVLSESAKIIPQLKVLEWLRANAERTYVSRITLGELAYGIERLPQGRKRRNLELWLRSLTQRLKGRILTFNARVALEWGRLVAEMEARGLRMPVADSQIAATARRHGLTVVSDNVEDFRPSRVPVLNPFD
jgi:toxin FitB